MLKKVILKITRIFRAIFFGLGWYFKDLIKYKNLLKQEKISVAFKYFPQIFDREAMSHTFDKHYVYMDRWAFKKILVSGAKEHVDVGSSIRFLSMVSSIIKLKFVDIRPVKIDFDNYTCIEGSILKMPFSDNSIESLSCLHVAEHIGLGRYGDPLDALGTIKACTELTRVLKPGGKLYFALPIGKNAIYFNAHRVHSPEVILDYFKNLKLVSFSAVSDNGNYIEIANLENFKTANYSCGMFEFTK